MTTLSIRLPDSLHRLAKDIATADHVSMNQFIASAVAEKVSALACETYLKQRAEQGDVDKFKIALSQVPDVSQDEVER